jgi:hypothetical protein
MSLSGDVQPVKKPQTKRAPTIAKSFNFILKGSLYAVLSENAILPLKFHSGELKRETKQANRWGSPVHEL